MDLHLLIEQQDYQGILQIDSSSQEIITCKIIALILLEKYVEALDSIAELNTKQLQFEKAYCFYKTNQLEKSLETIENETDERFCLLKAQVLYRLDRFEECLEVYSKLPDEEDIETNRKACLALMNNGTTTSTTSNSFATIFNIGCMYANQQKYRLAEQKFIEAMEICRQDMIQEGASENEIEKEVAVIMAQQGFIQQCQGSNQNALATYRSVLASGIEDPVIIAITNNNIAALQESNLLEATKQLKLFENPAVDSKLNNLQKEIIEFNNIVVSSLLGRPKLQEKVRNMEKKFPASDRLKMLQISLQLKAFASPLKALQEAQKFANFHPTSISAQLVLLQFHLHCANFNAMEPLIQKLLKQNCFSEYQPGLISLLVWLFRRRNNSEEALKLLISKKAVNSRNERLQLANFKLKLGRYQDAAPDFEQLVKENEHDTKAIAGYVMCLSQSDPFQASSYLDVLKQQIIVENVDEDILEILPGRAAKASIEKTKSKRKRSKPVPKNFNPDALPDPERWLPKYLRSNVKKPKTKSTGFQGVVLEGGGIGGTGSARIAGMKAPSLPLMEKKTESEKIQKKPIPAVLLSKKKKRK